MLVVEDNPRNLKLMKNILNKLGCESFSASNGKEAVKQAKRNKYDICFMDIRMPEMDGFEATRKIHNTIDKKLPIIALSADARKQEQDKAKEVGMIEYLTKPITMKKLKDAIVKWKRKRL